ncbi:MAG: dynamin family protein, partial [Promicromonosporaceae bacterium]|nr:dynamin family protein [Promicromonosporaceae bacterium]
MVSASASVSVDSTVLDVVTDLRREVAKIGFPLPIVGAEEAEASRRRLEQQLDTHLLPRLREAASPALVVVAGSTGAGKSTLVNSLIGSDISPAGVLRPTTRQPVLACNPADEPLLPGGRIKQISRVVFDEAVPRGLALCDAPDLDSLVAENRSLAEELLEAADLWLFVTTPRR